MADLPDIQIENCLKCEEWLSPRCRPRGYCDYCAAIVKGEEEAKHQNDLSKSLGNANNKAMR